jgi:hypothetical protein
VSDDHCSIDGSERCVRQTFGSATIGSFCFPSSTAGECTGEQPFFEPTPIQNIDGENVNVCLLRSTTCPGLDDYALEECEDDADCGAPNVADGTCESGLCTISCSNSIDCGVSAACDLNTGLCEL